MVFGYFRPTQISINKFSHPFHCWPLFWSIQATRKSRNNSYRSKSGRENYGKCWKCLNEWKIFFFLFRPMNCERFSIRVERMIDSAAKDAIEFGSIDITRWRFSISFRCVLKHRNYGLSEPFYVAGLMAKIEVMSLISSRSTDCTMLSEVCVSFSISSGSIRAECVDTSIMSR